MFGFFQSIGIWEIVFILVIVLIIFGPGKLPEVGKAMGKTLRSFKDAQKTVEKDISNVMKDDEEEKTAQVKTESNETKTE